MKLTKHSCAQNGLDAEFSTLKLNVAEVDQHNKAGAQLQILTQKIQSVYKFGLLVDCFSAVVGIGNKI